MSDTWTCPDCGTINGYRDGRGPSGCAVCSYGRAPAAPQSDQLGPNVYRGDDGVDRVLGISSGLLPPSDQPAQGEPQRVYRCAYGHTFVALAHSALDAPHHCPECGNKDVSDRPRQLQDSGELCGYAGSASTKTTNEAASTAKTASHSDTEAPKPRPTTQPRVCLKRSDFSSPGAWMTYLDSVINAPEPNVIVQSGGTCLAAPATQLAQEQSAFTKYDVDAARSEAYLDAAKCVKLLFGDVPDHESCVLNFERKATVGKLAVPLSELLTRWRKWVSSRSGHPSQRHAATICADELEAVIGAAPASQPVVPGEPAKSSVHGSVEKGSVGDINRSPKPDEAPFAPSSGADARELAEKFQKRLTKEATARPDGVWWAGPLFVSELAALLESFRAAAVEEARIFLQDPANRKKWGKGEAHPIAAYGHYYSAGEYLRELQPDPNWLARQIAKASLDGADFVLRSDSHAISRYRNGLKSQLAALESAKSNPAPTSKKE